MFRYKYLSKYATNAHLNAHRKSAESFLTEGQHSCNLISEYPNNPESGFCFFIWNQVLLASSLEQMKKSVCEAIGVSLGCSPYWPILEQGGGMNPVPARKYSKAFKKLKAFFCFCFKNYVKTKFLVHKKDSSTEVPISQIRIGQTSALALSVFLALNKKLTNGANLIIFEDPVTYTDDLNILSFFYSLSGLAFQM